MKIRNNRLPYFFPLWKNGLPEQGALGAFLEFDVEKIAELSDRTIFSIIDSNDDHITFEWMNECFEVIG